MLRTPAPLSRSQSGESTPLLGPHGSAPGPSSRVLSEVYPLIHQIRIDVLGHIDTPLTHEQLLSPESTYTIVRPLTEKYLELQNQSTVFCLLLNKVQFVRDSQKLSISTLSVTRATLCEILAIRVLRGWSERSLPLATVLLAPWAIFQGAPDEIFQRAREEGDEDMLGQTGNALEMAIVSSSKRFIRSPSCQKVIEGIWSGRIIYSAQNARALIADNYKKKPIQMYNPHKAPLLDHYRLKVPKIRAIIEYTNFLVLFCLYVMAMEGLEDARLNWRELAFIIYASAFSLDKLAAVRERGVKVFSSSLVNGFDLTFMLIYGVYLGARVYGFHNGHAGALRLGADWLAIGAVLIFPRLAFVTLANNLMVLSIRSMLTEFFFLMSVAVFCFGGFVYALFTLSAGRFALSQIGWWLLEVYFGLDASGFESAHEFHPFLGPLLMVSYALLSNTLLLTVLVAILGNTFATINADAAAESMFRKAVSTIEGVKADAVFSYSLPFNLVAVIVMWPMRYILNPRWFHKLNVTMIRVTNLPALLIIALYERQQYKDQTLLEQLWDFLDDRVGYLPRKIRAAAGFDGFSSSQDIGYVFEIEREVGSYYTGWDEEILDEVEMQLEASLPAPDDISRPATPPNANTSAAGAVIASPARIEPDERQKHDRPPLSPPRSRATSMPSNTPSPTTSAHPTGPRARPRRNSSIHEPSPLARLFVRSPERVPRRRTMTMVQALLPGAGGSSHPHTSLLADVLVPKRRTHGRSESQPVRAMTTAEGSAADGGVHNGGGGAVGGGLGTLREGVESERSKSPGAGEGFTLARARGTLGARESVHGVRFPSLDIGKSASRRSDGERDDGEGWAGKRDRQYSGEVSTVDSAILAKGLEGSDLRLERHQQRASSKDNLIDLGASTGSLGRRLASGGSSSVENRPSGLSSRERSAEHLGMSPLPHSASIPLPQHHQHQHYGTMGTLSKRVGKASEIEEGAAPSSPPPGTTPLPSLGAVGASTGTGAGAGAGAGPSGVSVGMGEDEMRKRLDAVDRRQRRIEELLERLVAAQGH